MLSERIDAEVKRILRSSKPSQSVVYTGSRHGAFPTLLVTDPILEPVDKLVWMIASSRIVDDRACGALPSYKDLARLANIRSSSTIARALAILRATRWLSLCRQVRDVHGRFRGNVYALHEEPALLSDALQLDAGYFDFLTRALSHAHRRVQVVARSIDESIGADVAEGRHAHCTTSPVERRMRSAKVVSDAGGGRYFALTATAQERLNRDRSGESESEIESDDNRVRYSKTAGSGSNNKNTTTTTPNLPFEKGEKLIFPVRLNQSHRALAMKYLDRVAPDNRQALLDELEGRLQASRYGAAPVWDAMRYLFGLCARCQAGEFHPNLGVHVAADRERLRQLHRGARTPTESDDAPPSDNAEENLQKLRELVAGSLRLKR